jgi:hypothetical protein
MKRAPIPPLGPIYQLATRPRRRGVFGRLLTPLGRWG